MDPGDRNRTGGRFLRHRKARGTVPLVYGGERADENMESLSEIRSLTPEVVHMMDEMLRSNKIPAVVKVRLMEIILERTFGKPEAAIRLSTAQQNVEAAQERISAIVSKNRISNE